MKKKTVFLMWIAIIMFIMVLIPYIQNAWGWPASSGISLFMGYYKVNDFPPAYLYIVTMWIIRWVVITLFIQSLLNDFKGEEPTKFDLNQ